MKMMAWEREGGRKKTIVLFLVFLSQLWPHFAAASVIFSMSRKEIFKHFDHVRSGYILLIYVKGFEGSTLSERRRR